MKKQMNVRLSKPARDKLTQLTNIYGSQTVVIELAIDRMYKKEMQMYEQKLTQEKMQCAHMARQVEIDPSPVPTTGDREADARIERELEIGRKILEQYTLMYSSRFTVLPPDVPAGVDGMLKVNSGHIANQPAYRLAMFRRRIEKIEVQYSADGLGLDELSESQQREFARQYGESLAKELEAEYPGVEIEVELTLSNRVTAYAGDDLNRKLQTEDDVQQLIHEHWQRWIDQVAMQVDLKIESDTEMEV